MELRLK